MDGENKVLLFKPDSILDTTNWVKVLMVSSRCNTFTREQFETWNKTHHVLMRFPEWGHGFHKPGFQVFIIDESKAEAVLLAPR